MTRMCRAAPRLVAGLALLAAAAAGALADTSTSSVTVETKQVSFEETHVLTVNSTVEFILQFVPAGDQGLWPSRLWVRVNAGDTAHPLLITARQRTGALTWQLPYHSGDVLLYEMERALCPDDSVLTEALGDNCGSAAARGALSVHVGTSCAGPVTVQLRAAPDRSWLLPFDRPVDVYTLQGAPRVHYYQFASEQESVRLVLESADDVCATIAVQNYTCPIAETLEDVETSALRMTMQRSGGVQLSRRRYPRGFYVVALVRDSDAACRATGADHSTGAGADNDWLWQAAMLAAAQQDLPAPPQRAKTLTIIVKASLSRAQYAVGVAATLALFLAFYVGFGALVLAQRLPACKRLVGPRAVLAHTAPESNDNVEEQSMSVSSPPGRRRRDSTATFDSSDNSDTDEEETATATTATATATTATATASTATSITATAANTAPASLASPASPAVNGVYIVDTTAPQAEAVEAAAARPFGLPARLHVAALARRRARVLGARSDRYLYTLYTVALFYALPVLQFVAAFQLVLNVSGSLDICYYNFLCAHPAGALSDFNHVFSNAGYLLLGALFMLQVRRRRARRRRRPPHEDYGIPAHYGLLSSLGASMMMVALLSAAYHVCPNGLNFQFDTAFMYVMAVLSMVKIYQARHPDVNARAHATFGVLAVLIALVVWGVLAGGPLFWSVFTVLHVFSVLLLSLNIYYVGQFRLGKASLAEAARGLRSRPLYTARLVMLLIANAVNWAFALYGLFVQSADFASHLLFVLLVNVLLHMVFYISMKLLHGERLRWYSWAFLAAAAGCWAPALYFFMWGSTSWAASPAVSRHSNHECRVLQFYDSHDLWHMLSAVALYFSFNAMLTWDDGLAAVERTRIAVF